MNVLQKDYEMQKKDFCVVANKLETNSGLHQDLNHELCLTTTHV